MSADIRELLPLYALDALSPDEARAVERAVAADPALAAELAAYRDAAHELVAVAPAAVPGHAVKARLMASVGAGRFERFAARMSTLFDVTIDRARELLGLMERDASWQPGLPGLALVHFPGGPAGAHADCGFIRIAPGCTFPWHRHRGEEVSVILAGTLRDHEGRLLRAGDELVQAQDSHHELTPAGEDEVIFAACAFGGIEIAKRP